MRIRAVAVITACVVASLAFSNDELAGLIQQATGVDTAVVIAEWLRPLP